MSVHVSGFTGFLFSVTHMRSTVALVVFALVATFFSPLAARPAAAATSGVDCLCSLTGPYVNATPGVAPAVDASGSSPHGTYTVSANITGGQVNLSVTRTGVTTPILQTSIPANAGWGFSPDDDRFVYHYVTAPTDNVFLYDLAARRQVWTTAVATGSDSIGFSPHGRYLIYSAITAPQHVQLTIADAVAGDAHKYFTEFTVFPGFPIGGATTNTAGWGFSPDSADRTFVYAFASAQTSAQWNVVNLASLTVVHNETITAISSFWQFSPCGDVIGIVTQPFLQQVETRLFGTTTTGGALQGSDQTFAFANVAFRATATSHIANVNGTDHTLAANTAGAGGGRPPPPRSPPRAPPQRPRGACAR